MPNQKMIDALNGQINRELYSSYLYLSMSAYFESIKLPGSANWMRVQAGEELVHAMKMYDYVISSGGRAKMLAVEAPPYEWQSPVAVFENVYNHERAVTGLINNLVSLATAEKDEQTLKMLQWYVDEQVEEEESSGTVLSKVKVAVSEQAMQSVDKEMGQRRFKFPSGYQIFGNGGMKGAGSTIGSLKK